MAQQVEPMDVEDISEFDNKENSLHHSNVPPHTEKGYEELDVSELNMKLRYSMTPVSSPMSKSYTGTCFDNRSQDSDLNNTVQDNNSKSLDSTVTETLKSPKLLPLQSLPTDSHVDSSCNLLVLRPFDATTKLDSENNPNVTITVSNDSDENISFPSTSSSPVHTPEATTPVKEMPKSSGSPIMRGLKSVMSMFRPSQSPILLEDDGSIIHSAEVEDTSNDDVISTTSADFDSRSQSMLASTPLAHKHDREVNLKRESLVFKDDLEKELMWKDETTIIFSKEKIPIHKLFLPQSNHESPENQSTSDMSKELNTTEVKNKINTTVEPMDISNNNSMLGYKTMTENQSGRLTPNTENEESVFLDCETTMNESKLLETTMEKDTTSETRKLEYANVNGHVGDTTIKADASQDSDVTRLNDTNLSMKSAEMLTAIEAEYLNKIANIPLSTDVRSESASVPSPKPVSEKSQIAQLVASTALDVIKALSLPVTACVVQPVVTISNNAGNDNVHVAVDNPQGSLLNNTLTPCDGFDEVKEEVREPPKESVDVINPDTINTENSEGLPKNIMLPDIQEATTVETESKLDASVNVQTVQGEIGMTTTENGGGASNKIVPTVRYVAENFPLPDDNENFDSIEFTETVTPSGVVDVINPDKINTENSECLPKNIMLPDVQDATTVETESKLDASVNVQTVQGEIGMTTTENGGGASNKIVPTVRYVAENFPLPDDNENFDSIEFTETVMPSGVVTSEAKHEDLLPDIQENQGEIHAVSEMLQNIPSIEIVNDDSVHIVDAKDTTDLHALGNIPVDSINTVAKQLEESLNQLNKTDLLVGINMIHVNESINAGNSVAPGSNLTVTKEITEAIEPTHHLYETLSSVDSALLNMTQGMNAVQPHEISKYNPIDYECVITSGQSETDEDRNESKHKLNNKDVDHPKDGKSLKKDETSVDGLAVIISQSEICAEEQDPLPEIPPKCAEIEDQPLVSAENVKDENMDVSLTQVCDILHTNPIIDVIHQLNITTDISTETTELPDFESHETLDDIQVEIVDEDHELILSENNSPYVSLSAGTEDIPLHYVTEPYAIETKDCFATKIKMSPPLSPKLPGKGYNLNFDDIEDPFASKTKIRLSPPPGDKTDEKSVGIEVDSVSNNINDSLKLDTDTTNVVVDSLVKESAVDMNVTSTRDQDMKIVPDVSPAIKEIISSVIEIPDMNITSKTVDNADIIIETNATSVDNADSKDKLNISINKQKDQEVVSDKPEMLPQSPNIPVKGYNFNFDEIEDPFISKTKMRMSPPPRPLENQSNDTLDKVNDRKALEKIADSTIIIEKSQNINIDKTFDNSASNDVAETPAKGNNTLDINNTPKAEINMSTQLVVQDIVAENITKMYTESETRTDVVAHKQENQTKTSDDLIPEQNILTESNTSVQVGLPDTSSSEQSIYFSAGASSGESTTVIPAIDDVNPFATKSKIASSPERSLQTTETVSPMKVDHEVKVLYFDNKTYDNSKLESESNESRDTCSNSSKATEENDITSREVHTEDEDTMEGPFIEAELHDCGDKMPDIADEKLDLNHLAELPTQGPEENVNEEAGEMFIDADAFEYLMNQNQSSMVSDSGKESLFLKFDPLFAKRVNSDGVVDALSKMKRRQSTPKKMKRPPVPKDLIFMGNSPVAGPSHVSADNNPSEDVSDELNVTVAHKPIMAVPPAVNPVVTPRKKVTSPTTPTRSNRLSMPFTSSAMDVIDRLISLSANNSPANPDITIPHMIAEQNEADHALLQLRELLAEKELNVHHLRCETKELKDRMSVLASQMSVLETESDRRLKNINELNQKLTERSNLNKKMASVVEEYERTISGLIAALEEDKKKHAEERDELVKDRDEQSAHLASMEVAFSDLHSKYEKTKQQIFSYKAREDTYKKSIGDFEENLIKIQNNYEQLKQHATSKLNHANQELEKINKGHESEVLKMTAMIKRKDLHISSLEETLAQKTKANEELASICDELINKVG